MLSSGAHPKIVSERLGHATTKLTLDTYSHVTPTMQDEATVHWPASCTGPRRRPRGDSTDAASEVGTLWAHKRRRAALSASVRASLSVMLYGISLFWLGG